LAEVVWTEEAISWLRDIHDYIAAENPAAAARVAEGFYAPVDQPRDHPESGYRYEASPRHVRILVYGH
jgi:plasmid stabilization system protein ParE